MTKRMEQILLQSVRKGIISELEVMALYAAVKIAAKRLDTEDIRHYGTAATDLLCELSYGMDLEV